MYSLLTTLRHFFHNDGVRTTSHIFQLHCTITAVLLFAASLLIGGYQMLSTPIQCSSDSSMGNSMVNLHCLIDNIFTLPDLSSDVAIYPGVGAGRSELQRTFHAYYPYVSFVTFCQAFFFCLPKWIWSNWEAGLMKSLTAGLQPGIIAKTERRGRVTCLVDFLKRNSVWNTWYAIYYMFCELLCIVNVGGQLYAIDYFLGNQFLTYGWRVVNFWFENPYERNDPMQLIFPKAAMCNINSVGPSGTTQKHGALCLLPQNVINEKVYVVMWFWFAFLFSLLALQAIRRIVTLLFPCIRSAVFRMNHPIAMRKGERAKLAKMPFGDWWMLTQLGNNLDTLVFQNLVAEYFESNPFYDDT